MATVLYISLTGMTEPLGESQVVQYLLELSKSNTIYLLSFEKPVDNVKLKSMYQRLKEAGISWEYLPYSNRFGIFSSLLQIIHAMIKVKKITKKNNIQIIHSRSLIPAVMGLLAKYVFKTKLLFDIRGFAIDEKIVEGRLKSASIVTRSLKMIEKWVYKKSDHIVTLTHASKPIIQNNYLVNEQSITVIPTCANREIFNILSVSEKQRLRENLGYTENDYIVLHNGSLNSWVDFEAEIKLFEQLQQLNRDVKFLFLNKGQHKLIKHYLHASSIAPDKYKIISADLTDISNYLNVADSCVFFIKPFFAKKASAPTKFAEMVACHLPAISNSQYGDMEYYLAAHPVGLLFNLNEVHLTPKKIAEKVLKLMIDNRTSKTKPIQTEHFTDLFLNHFSKDVAIKRYQLIYDTLTG